MRDATLVGRRWAAKSEAGADDPRSRRGERGYSLVEVLVALFIVAMLSAAGFAALSSTLRTKDVLEARELRLRELQLSRATLRADLAQLARPRPVRGPFGAPEPLMFSGGFGDDDTPLLAFLRTGWANPAGLERRGPLQFVEYFLRDGALVRRARLRPDITPDTPVAERVILTGVREARVRFAEADWSQGPVWREEWRIQTDAGETSPLPRMISLELELDDFGLVSHRFSAPDMLSGVLQARPGAAAQGAGGDETTDADEDEEDET